MACPCRLIRSHYFFLPFILFLCVFSYISSFHSSSLGVCFLLRFMIYISSSSCVWFPVFFSVSFFLISLSLNYYLSVICFLQNTFVAIGEYYMIELLHKRNELGPFTMSVQDSRFSVCLPFDLTLFYQRDHISGDRYHALSFGRHWIFSLFWKSKWILTERRIGLL